MSQYSLELSDAEVARYQLMAGQARGTEAAQWQAAGICPGARVADIGCGPGAVLAAMADVVGDTGSVVGIDAAPAAIAAAAGLIDRENLTNARVQLGEAVTTGLDPDSFDVVVMRHVLAHNGGLEQIIVDHLLTLVRPGGCLYVVDVEMTAMRLCPASPDIEDLIGAYGEFHRSHGNDPQIGLRLAELLRTAGLEVLDHRGFYNIVSAPPGMRPPAWAAREAMLAAGQVTEADLSRWETAFELSDAAPERPNMFVPQFSATGRRTA